MTIMLTPADRDRLIKILGLLASDQDGERAAAGWTAARMLRDRGLEWSGLIAPALPTPQNSAAAQAASPDAMWSKQIVFLLRRPEFLTEWEQQFVRSISARSRLSQKQADILHRVFGRVAAWEAK